MLQEDEEEEEDYDEDDVEEETVVLCIDDDTSCSEDEDNGEDDFDVKQKLEIGLAVGGDENPKVERDELEPNVINDEPWSVKQARIGTNRKLLTCIYSFIGFGRRAYYNNTVTLLIDLV
jgi:hypothetical protein